MYSNRRSLTTAAFVAAVIVLAASALLRASADAPSPRTLTVTVQNELPFARTAETIELKAESLKALDADLDRIHVFEAGSGKEILAQSIDLDRDGSTESLIFQAEIPAHAARSFVLRSGDRRAYRKEDFRVYGRFVRERFDDFAWENDRTAHRMYGAALETWQKEPLTSSTVDIWLKRTKRLVINDWYMVDDYHRDNGDGGDFYSAGRSRGCGGSGLWREGKLVVSRNFRNSRVLAAGPIRLVFELDYPAWDAAGVRSETKRITLDAGRNLSRFESRYDVDGEVKYAVGIKKQPGADYRADREHGWMRTWEPVKGGTGKFGCAVLVDPVSTVTGLTESDGNYLITADAPAAYYAGAGWDQSGDFPGVADWDRYITQWAQRIASPLHVEVRNQ